MVFMNQTASFIQEEQEKIYFFTVYDINDTVSIL